MFSSLYFFLIMENTSNGENGIVTHCFVISVFASIQEMQLFGSQGSHFKMGRRKHEVHYG